MQGIAFITELSIVLLQALLLSIFTYVIYVCWLMSRSRKEPRTGGLRVAAKMSLVFAVAALATEGARRMAETGAAGQACRLRPAGVPRRSDRDPRSSRCARLRHDSQPALRASPRAAMDRACAWQALAAPGPGWQEPAR